MLEPTEPGLAGFDFGHCSSAPRTSARPSSASAWRRPGESGATR